MVEKRTGANGSQRGKAVGVEVTGTKYIIYKDEDVIMTPIVVHN